MSYLHAAAILLALVAYGCFCVFVGCCVKRPSGSSAPWVRVVFWWV